jgi:hypothetical protein
MRFVELEMIWRGFQAQDEAEGNLRAALRSIHADNASACTLVHPSYAAAHDYLVAKMLGSDEAVDWWNWWRFEVAGHWRAPDYVGNVQLDGRVYRIHTLEDLYAWLVLLGHLPADPDFAHSIEPVEAAG